MVSYIRIIFMVLSLIAGLHCGSLIDEAARVNKLYEVKAGLVPAVGSTDPADGSIAPYNQTYVDVIFSQPINTASFGAQSTFGACSGTFQVSYDGFNNCLAGSVDASANPRIRFTPTVFPKGLGLQARVSGVLSPAGNVVTTYTSPTGFKLGAPCGNENCFFSYSTPLMANAGTRSGIFPIRTGTNAGKYLVYSSGGAGTTLIDPVTVSSSAGPALPFSPADGAHNFYISSGTHVGKQAIIRGGNSNQWCLYDPDLNSCALQPVLALTVGAGGASLQPASGNDLGNTLFLRGVLTNSVLRYTASTGLVSNPGGVLLTSGNISSNAHTLRLQTGINIGSWVIFHGGADVGMSLLTEATPTITASTAAQGSVGNGASSFEVTSGARSGQVITALGGNSGAVSILDTATFASSLLNSALTGNVTGGGLLLRQVNTNSYDNPLVIHGGAHSSSLYDSASGAFTSGPATTGAMFDGSVAAFIPSVTNGGAFLIVNGNGMPSTSVYFPATNTFSGTRAPSNVPNAGSNAFVISGGAQNGRTLIVSGNLTNETAIFDPLRIEMHRGPQLTFNATTDTFNVPLPQLSRALVFRGGATTTYNIYDPNSNSFSASGGPTLGGGAGSGAVSFPIAGTTKIVIMRGGGSNQGDIIDQANITAAPSPVTAPGIVSSAPLTIRFTKTSTGEIRQLVSCSGNFAAIFDHATGLFVGGVTLTGTGGPGMQAYVIPSGGLAGRILVIHGNGNSSTTIINPEDNTAAAGPDMNTGTCAPGSVSNGGQLLPLTTGINAGKALVVRGGGSPATCLFDPALGAFAGGPAVSLTASPGFQISNGALAFRTNGGLYATSFVLLSGATKNVFSIYVP